MLQHLRCSAAVLAALLLVARSPATETDEEIPDNPIVKAVQKVKASVVAVKVQARASGNRTREMVGTGLIIDERGFIITNRHVIAGSLRTTVRLLDKTEVPAEVLHSDPAYDLAILRIRTTKKLVAQPLAQSIGLKEGQDVIAVGHPFGYTYTVSRGIVSALGRAIEMPNGYTLTGLIQTDASINPGNSGGPLLDIRGGVIGINVALREDAHGIAFAINSETVKQVLSEHLSAYKIAGITHGLKCSEQTVARAGRRVVVSGLDPRMVAAGASLKSGDAILAVGQLRVTNRFDVERAFWDARPGQIVNVTVLREGREMSVTLPLVSESGQVAAVSRQ